MKELKVKSGMVFGSLTILHETAPKYYSGQESRAFLCECECGNVKAITASNLLKGITRSCGCLRSWMVRRRFTKHGLRSSAEYSSWRNAKTRCYNKNDRQFHLYGGRGITMCDRWINSFQNFFSDMGKKPTASHTLERKDNNGNYEPSNCKWATMSEQNRNKRKWGSCKKLAIY